MTVSKEKIHAISTTLLFSSDMNQNASVGTVVGGGLVGSAVASNIRHLPLLIPTLANFYLPIVNSKRKDKNKEKEAENGPCFF